MSKKHYREPIKHTCPDIDRVLDKISTVESLCSVNGREQEEDLKEIISTIRSELSGLDYILEKLRNSNDDLRSWGIDEAERVDELEVLLEEVSN